MVGSIWALDHSHPMGWLLIIQIGIGIDSPGSSISTAISRRHCRKRTNRIWDHCVNKTIATVFNWAYKGNIMKA
jgi:hypothetical protein